MIPCIIFDTHRGVYFGTVDYETWKTAPCDWITVHQFRHCYTFNTTGGVYELAVNGPDKGCRIGVTVPEVTICDVSKIVPCSETAALALRQAVWAR